MYVNLRTFSLACMHVNIWCYNYVAQGLNAPICGHPAV